MGKNTEKRLELLNELDDACQMIISNPVYLKIISDSLCDLWCKDHNLLSMKEKRFYYLFNTGTFYSFKGLIMAGEEKVGDDRIEDILAQMNDLVTFMGLGHVQESVPKSEVKVPNSSPPDLLSQKTGYLDRFISIVNRSVQDMLRFICPRPETRMIYHFKP